MGSYVTLPSLCLSSELPEISAVGFAAHSAGGGGSKELTTGWPGREANQDRAEGLMSKDSGCFLHLQGTLEQRGLRDPVFTYLHPRSLPLTDPLCRLPKLLRPSVFHFRPNLTLSGT